MLLGIGYCILYCIIGNDIMQSQIVFMKIMIITSINISRAISKVAHIYLGESFEGPWDNSWESKMVDNHHHRTKLDIVSKYILPFNSDIGNIL